jgi:hypothetical protein
LRLFRFVRSVRVGQVGSRSVRFQHGGNKRDPPD